MLKRPAPLPAVGLFDVVDAGCGNGRFAELISAGGSESVSYLGIDTSPPLVAEAGRRYIRRPGFAPSWVVADLVDGGVGGRSGFQAEIARSVVAFGLFHHVAGAERRRRLLSTLSDLLRPGGLLAVSFWQFGKRERFLRRRVPWAEHNRGAGSRIQTDELDPGDFLLRWGSGEDREGPVRYCHYASPEEADSLVSALPLDILDRFPADGRSGDLNLYYVLRKPRSGASERGVSKWVSG